MEIFILMTLSVLMLIWGMYNFLGYRKEKREIRRQFEGMFQKKDNRKSAISKFGDRFDETPFAREFKQKLTYANIPILPSEFFAIMLFFWFALILLMNGFFNVPFSFGIFISAIACAASYFLLFLVRRNKYFDRLNGQLSEVCRLLSNSTRAGLTINQGIELVAAEIASPAKEEFKELAHNLRLGVEFERALKGLEKKVPTREFKLFVSALMIQKRSGGNLTKVLSEMARTLEERKILQQTIKTATAEQRFVSYILPAMPIFLLFMLNSIMDGFLDLIFTLPGAILTGIFLVGMVISLLLVRAVTNIKV
ncbi:type II secretion system F family protein [Bacillus sp. FJAT-27445]|uniref:type II secretion system F family protein n=1 Tax=Bacillus sp. FJAT-27445 TaxID=1679166 RepID=UPI0007431C69|nr:type II secretion system F family protein [Bacillus sp. FJAT-27445]